MIDLTGANLCSFILQEIRPVVEKHPRFRNNRGEVVLAFSNLLAYGDVRITINNVSSSGNQLSADNYACTLIGRSALAQLEGKDGSFIEWAQDIDPTGKSYVPGLYYFHVSSVNHQDQTIELVIQRMRWLEERRTQQSYGSIIRLASSIDREDVEPVDSSISLFPYMHGFYLRTYTDSLLLRQISTGHQLIPMADYWFEQTYKSNLVASTQGAYEEIPIPDGVESFKLFDGDYELRQGVDYNVNAGNIVMGAGTPRGLSIDILATYKLDPSSASPVHPENQLLGTLSADEQLVASQVYYELRRGSFGPSDVIQQTGGSLWAKNLQEPGDNLTWEARAQGPLQTKIAKRMSTNTDLIPGVLLAFGDKVFEGDQAVLFVFPDECETYQVYAGKEETSFDIEVKANDLMTASEIAADIRTYMTVTGRERIESAGFGVGTIGKTYRGETKDVSGTSASHVFTLSVRGLADWEYRKPLITRIATIDVSGVDMANALPGKPFMPSSIKAFGIEAFMPRYS